MTDNYEIYHGSLAVKRIDRQKLGEMEKELATVKSAALAKNRTSKGEAAIRSFLYGKCDFKRNALESDFEFLNSIKSGNESVYLKAIRKNILRRDWYLILIDTERYEFNVFNFKANQFSPFAFKPCQANSYEYFEIKIKREDGDFTDVNSGVNFNNIVSPITVGFARIPDDEKPTYYEYVDRYSDPEKYKKLYEKCLAELRSKKTSPVRIIRGASAEPNLSTEDGTDNILSILGLNKNSAKKQEQNETEEGKKKYSLEEELDAALAWLEPSDDTENETNESENKDSDNDKEADLKLSMALWLYENTKLSYEQIAGFLNISQEDVQKVADGETAMEAINPIEIGIISREEIERCEDNLDTPMSYEELHRELIKLKLQGTDEDKDRKRQGELRKEIEAVFNMYDLSCFLKGVPCTEKLKKLHKEYIQTKNQSISEQINEIYNLIGMDMNLYNRADYISDTKDREYAKQLIQEFLEITGKNVQNGKEELSNKSDVVNLVQDNYIDEEQDWEDDDEIDEDDEVDDVVEDAQEQLQEEKEVVLDEKQREIYDLIANTNDNIFIQGRAGTGKSEIINHLQKDTNKSILCTAFTGIAAEKINGTTINSLFKIGPAAFYEPKKYKMIDKDSPVRFADTIIIDEVSMLRPDLLDTVDGLCKIAKKNNKPFGGIQMVFIGDLHQLPPIITFKGTVDAKTKEKISKEEIKSWFSERYGCGSDEDKSGDKKYFFFDAKAYKDANFQFRELTKVYRQHDEKMLENLDNISKEQNLDEATDYFNSCVVDNPEEYEQKDMTIISPWNEIVDGINVERLSGLDGEEGESKATDKWNDIGEKDELPADKKLKLKVGALVRFCKNDGEKRRFVNGTQGKVVKFFRNEDGEIKSIKVEILSKDNKYYGKRIIVEKARWDKMVYTRNPDTGKLELINDGKHYFIQFPLVLAYAMTVHKSQGQTLDEAFLKISGKGNVWDHGMLYVALSRVKKLSGIHIDREITEADIHCDERVKEFLEKPNQYNTPEDDSGNIIENSDKACNIISAEKLRQNLHYTGIRDIFSTGGTTRTDLIEYLNYKYGLSISPHMFTGISKEDNKYINCVNTTYIHLDWWLCLYDKNKEVLRLYFIPRGSFKAADFRQISGLRYSGFQIQIEKRNGSHVIILKDGRTRDIDEEFFKLECDLKGDETVSSDVTVTSGYKPDYATEESYGKLCKAKDRIWRWSKRPDQMNHNIVWAYFKAEADAKKSGKGYVTIDEMCELFMKRGFNEWQFRSNYAAMKTDSGRSHGKVFEDDGRRVWIWDGIKDELLKYKKYFYDE